MSGNSQLMLNQHKKFMSPNTTILFLKKVIHFLSMVSIVSVLDMEFKMILPDINILELKKLLMIFKDLMDGNKVKLMSTLT